jgi:hypothetical protein
MPANVAYDRRHDPRRVTLREDFIQRPALNAVLDSYTPFAAATDLAKEVANHAWEVSGTNMTTALCTYNIAGGITMTCAGAAADQALLGAHTNTNQGIFNAISWLSNKEVSFECGLVLHSTITQMTAIAGLKLTSDPTIATDNDQAMFRIANTTVAAAWTFISSRSGTDTTTTVRPEIAATVASTYYRLRIDVLSDRTVIASIGTGINGSLVPIGVAPLPALTTGIALKPFIGVHAVDSAAYALHVRYVELGRLIV